MSKPTRYKILIVANRIADNYIATLKAGQSPMRLEAIIDKNKSGWFDEIGDSRLNRATAMSDLKFAAKEKIKQKLQSHPELARKLIEIRAQEDKKVKDEQVAEIRSWKPLPIIKD